MAALPVGRVLSAQLLITLLGLAGAFYDRVTGLSAGMGGALCLVPNALAAWGLFWRSRARGIREEQQRMQRAWTVRWIATLIGLALIFGLFSEVQPLVLFAAYIAAQAAHLIGYVSFQKR